MVDISRKVLDFETYYMKRGIEQGIEQMIQNALSKGHPPEEIVDFMDVSFDDVSAVQEKLLQEE